MFDHKVDVSGQALLSRSVNANPIGIIITDPNLPGEPIIYVNPGFEKLTGYTAAEIIGCNFQVLLNKDANHTGRISKISQAFDLMRDTKLIVPNRQKDGTLLWSELTISSVSDREGNLINRFGILTDVTDRVYREGLQGKRPLEGFLSERAGNYQDKLAGITGLVEEKNRPEGIWANQILPAKKNEVSSLDELLLNQHSPDHKNSGRSLDESGQQYLQSQKLETIGHLTGGIAHDFNNILTVILNTSELLQMQFGDNELLNSGLADIAACTQRAGELTRQLLAFSRNQVLQPKIIELNSVINNLGNWLKRVIGEDIQLTTILNPISEKIKADQSQIEQVIMNLIVNARDAMPSGGTLTIETTEVIINEENIPTRNSLTPGKYIVLSVTDTGCGMDKTTLNHIFEPFFTTKEAGKGSGLGLSTVYGIVKKSGGNIWVGSEVGAGTTFKIFLPVIHEEEAAQPAVICPKVAHKGTETILLVEDERDVRYVTKTILERNGYKVIDTRDATEALEVIGESPESFDLILTDMVMPGMNGKELSEKVRQRLPGIKILFMSGYPNGTAHPNQFLEPNLPLIQKPFRPSELVQRIQETLKVI